MNTNEIKIFIDRLANEGDFSQQGTLDASILDFKESDGSSGPIDYNLNAYIADQHLVITFDAKCDFKLPCTICNEPTLFPVSIKKQTHLESLDNVKKGVYDAASCIREAILVNVPPFCECGGNCPERENIKKYLKSNHKEAEVYHPFQGL